MVFKPAELVPGCAWALAEIISRAGLPAGVFNLVMGSGRQVGQTLVDSPLVDAISFTGSVAVGERILAGRQPRGAPRCSSRWAARTRWSCWPMPTLDQAVECAVQGAYLLDRPALHGVEPDHRRGAGVRRLRRAAAPAHAGAGGRPRAGARHARSARWSAATQLEQNLAYVAIGRDEGAERLCGGEALERATRAATT